MTAKLKPGGWRRLAVEDQSGCLVWQGSINRDGYGLCCWTAASSTLAHRAVYELEIGPIPIGLTLDHLCRNRACVNPAHLEPVTLLENVRRASGHNGQKTHCPKGHPYDEANTNVRPHPLGGLTRFCRECQRLRNSARLTTRAARDAEPVEAAS